MQFPLQLRYVGVWVVVCGVIMQRVAGADAADVAVEIVVNRVVFSLY
jgi:hypothetical protein